MWFNNVKISTQQKFDQQQAFMKACEWDYCAHREEGSCQAVTNFVKECRNQDIRVPSSWRHPGFCR
jgi:putative ribosome biogenesis GTPase RsgA